MEGHFKPGKVPADLVEKGFEAGVTYECFYNGSNQLVVHHPQGAMAIVHRPQIESAGVISGPITIFKLTSNG